MVSNHLLVAHTLAGRKLVARIVVVVALVDFHHKTVPSLVVVVHKPLVPHIEQAGRILVR